MRAPAAVVDTNVVVAGLLTREPDAPTAIILDAMLAAEIHYLLSVELLGEYRRVLLRPAIRRRHGLAEEEIDRLLEELAGNAAVREPIEPPAVATDPNDAHLWALLAAEPAAVLVTGDRQLLDAPPEGLSAVSPRAFVRLTIEGTAPPHAPMP